MTPFDVLFIVLFLSALGSVLYAMVAAVTGHRSTARTLLRRLAAAVIAYMAIVYAVALLSPGRSLALGEDMCSDDWCIAVSDLRVESDSSQRVYDVTFRLSSRARRVSQRERGIVVYMRDTSGHRHDGEGGPTDAPFDVRIGPGETTRTHRRFVLPRDTSARDVVITRGGVPFPGCCIIGEATGLLHPAAVHVP